MTELNLEEMVIVGNRIPRDFFITKGRGESDLAVHAGSYHLALKSAHVECYNHMKYSSILPGLAREVPRPREYNHGAVLETIAAVAQAETGQRATAGIIYAWLQDRRTRKKYGGLVCEYGGAAVRDAAEQSLKASLNELYTHGFKEKYVLGKPGLFIESFVPKKKYGTAVVILGFLNYAVPVLKQE